MPIGNGGSPFCSGSTSFGSGPHWANAISAVTETSSKAAAAPSATTNNTKATICAGPLSVMVPSSSSHELVDGVSRR